MKNNSQHRSSSPLEGEGGSPRSGETDGGREARYERGVHGRAQARAKQLRQTMSAAERRLWSALRDCRLAGLKFRRQQPVGRYIADFFCARARLVVEVDGHQHWNEDQKWHDYRRTKWLESRGYRVVRFTSYDTIKHTSSVVEAIREAAIRQTRARLSQDQSPFEEQSTRAVPPSVAPSARQLPPQGGKR